MRCIISNSSDPYYNLAAEEFFLKNSMEEFFMLYINTPCIVVGKHQNLLSEINLDFSRKHNIKLARRISGGGTVYQDANNLNFSFIHNCINRELINFTRFTVPILEALKELGLKAEFSSRNDILIEEKKISGNAMHIYKNRVLSHGTLLFDSDLNSLSNALKSNYDRYTDKSIKSVKSSVTNISNYLDPPVSIIDFTKNIFACITKNEPDTRVETISDLEAIQISRISQEKYKTWNWIYGYSPKYKFRNSINVLDYAIAYELEVERGLIKGIELTITPSNWELEQFILNNLINSQHDYDIIEEKLKQISIKNSDITFMLSEFCKQLF